MGALGSGEYVRTPSFAMRAAVSDKTALRIPSPFPRPQTPTSSPRLKASISSPREPAIARPRVGMPTKANLESEHALSQAEMHLVLGDLDPASAFARRALAIEPGMPDARALLAYLDALASGPGQERQLRDSLSTIDAALREKATCRRGHYYRAEVRKRLEDHEGAIQDLREAVLGDPNDLEALRELRVYEQQLKNDAVHARPGGLRGLLRRTKD
jgi:tetratricopeptide (TPR) repeat protein